MQRINNKVFLSTEEIERWIPTDNGIHDNSVEPLSRFNVNGYENLERANQGSKERERERESNLILGRGWIPNHDSPSSLFSPPNFLVADAPARMSRRGANNGQNPSIVLKSRSNKCAAKFVNKSTSQPGAASPPPHAP